MIIVRAKSLQTLIVAVLCVVSLTACSTIATSGVIESQVAPNGVPNFQEVGPGVYRGGQPTTEGWVYLQKKGIKTVIKLDLASEGSDDEAVALGMVVVDASGPPADLTNFLEAPKPERIRLAVQTLENESLRPIYVHCLHGQDRTGLVIGLYRVLHDHKTKSEAYEEMRKNGFHVVFLGLLKVWEDFDGKTLP